FMFLRVLAWLNAKKNLCVAPLGLDIACFIGTHVFRRGLNNFAPLALGEESIQSVFRIGIDQHSTEVGSAGAEAQVNKSFSARLKSCPDTNHLCIVSSAAWTSDWSTLRVKRL